MTTQSQPSGSPSRTHKDYYTALYQAALTISSSLELEEVLQSVVTSITEAMEVKACSLRLLNERTGQPANERGVRPERRLPGERTCRSGT